MRFRTKLFAAWGTLAVLLYASSLLPIQGTIATSFDRVTRNSFEGTKQSLSGMQAEQVTRMRQECSLIMNIPELRALIAESSVELDERNLASLNERLDSLSTLVGVPVIFIIGGRGVPIAQSAHAPWDTITGLRRFLGTSPQATALVGRVFGKGGSKGGISAATQVQSGMWVIDRELYQVVGLPLTFGAQREDADIQGAMVMATPLTDAHAAMLAARHNCAVTFFCGTVPSASSLTAVKRAELAAKVSGNVLPLNHDFVMSLGGVSYESSFEPLIDPCSGTQVGGTLIQSDMHDSATIRSTLWRDLGYISLAGLAIAAVSSFILSATVTRPVQELLTGVRRVGTGDMEVAIPASGGELGELAAAFNDMVVKIRQQRDLERQVERSKLASKAKSQFLANMSHEIRTPLNGVTGMTELLSRTSLTPEQGRYVNLLQASARILSTVINDILDYSKIEAGKLELESLDFDLRATLQEVVDLLTPRVQAKGLQIVLTVAESTPTALRGDAKRLQQIAINLINNAIKFTESGHITVSAQPENVSNDSSMVRFAVMDTGIGIPPERLDRLFQSFSQVDASTTRKYGGTGLGLAICRQLAELMGGAIGVESTPGKGSQFWFTACFGRASQTPAAAAPAAGRVTRALCAAHVLVAEDNEINQIVVRGALQSAGHTCDVVGDGRAVLQAVARTRYDLVLMDCQMPEMDGFEASRQLRKWEEAQKGPEGARRRLPVIALTASATQADRELCLQCGMDDYVSKPIDFSQLIAVIDKYLADPAATLPLPAAERAASRAPISSTTLSPPPAAVPAVSAAPATAPAQTSPAFNVTSLRQRYSRTPQLLPTLLDRFQEQITKTKGELQTALAQSQLESFRAVVHSMKGAAGFLAAEKVVELAVTLEARSKAGDIAALQAGLADMQRELDACLQQIPSVRHVMDAPT